MKTATALPFLVVCLGLGLGLAAAGADSAKATREEAYRENNLGVAQLEQFQHAEAAASFRKALALAPDLAVAKLNLAIALFNVPDLEAAAPAAEAALAALPNAPQPLYVRGLIAKAQNRMADAAAAFQRVLEIDPDDVGACVNLGQLLAQERRYPEALELFKRALAVEPYNVTATYNLAMALMRSGAPADGQAQMQRFKALRESGRGTALGVAYPEQGRYAEGLTSTGAEKELVDPAMPAATWRVAETPAVPGARGVALLDADQDGDTDVALVTATGVTLLLNEGGGGQLRPGAPVALPALTPETPIVAGDYDNDGRTDLFVRGRLLHNEDGGRFTDVTDASGIQCPFVSHAAAWVDVDHDGDLDLFVSGFTEGPETKDAATQGGGAAGAAHRLFRNNGNGTFTEGAEAAKLQGTRRGAVAVVPTDFDNRRDIDLVIANANSHDGVELYKNMREGTFSEIAREVGLVAGGGVTCVAAGDVNKDSFTDFYFGQASGAGLFALSNGRGRFNVQPAPSGAGPALAAQFLDYDNDGVLDLLTVTSSGLRLQRAVGGGEWADVSRQAFAKTTGAFPAALASADLDGDGGLDLVFGDGRVLLSTGARPSSLRVRLSARVSNAGGVGAKVEILAGSLRQKIETVAATPAPAPSVVHIGLGNRSRVDAIRVLWPAGIVQAEVDLPGLSGAPAPARVVDVKELDRKPSSCPFLYAWNGSRFEFITDFMGAGEMGYWEGPGRYSHPDPDEYVLIRDDQLRPRDGRYDLTVTNELEEVLYLDHVQLLVLAHPPGTEVYPSEGMIAPPARPFALHLVRDVHAPRAAWDDTGRDVLERVVARDRRYVDGFPLHRIRGYAAEHALVLDLGELPARPVLLLNGWTDYAFSSDNLAAHQAGRELFAPILEARVAGGPWLPVDLEVGEPVGRPQTIALDLTGKLPAGAHEVRLRTNLRIYWDEVKIGDALDASAVATTRLVPEVADLKWRGYSAEGSADGREPYGYDFERVSLLSPWKVMPGRYTREGDVRPLLTSIDDRFVVSRPGDALTLRFDATHAGVPPGWRRSFLLYADGFSKEMDLNSASPDVVEPLPFHGMSAYPYPASEHYPEDEAHTRYRDEYNTRLVARPILPLEAVAEQTRAEAASPSPR